MSTNIDSKHTGGGALAVIREQVEAATSARKCHPCGCFHSTVAALENTDIARNELPETLARARSTFVEKDYDCLGCRVCFPAIAANALADAYPGQAEQLDLCPTDTPAERRGWPPLPGDYHVVRYRAPVAICTLNSDELASRLAHAAPEGLSIAGTLHTENLGVERLIRNVLGNPHLRFLILCGEDTQQAIGHLPGQSLASLFASGLDERGRIRGARGKRPVLKNVPREQVEAFVEQVKLVDMIGATKAERVARQVEACAVRDPGPSERYIEQTLLAPVSAAEPRRLIPDPAGYFVVYPDRPRSVLILEHYTNAGVLNTIIEGGSPAAVYATAIEKKLLSRLDHAAYLGRELTRAEHSMGTGERYVQDRAPGEVIEADERGCGCPASACGGAR